MLQSVTDSADLRENINPDLFFLAPEICRCSKHFYLCNWIDKGLMLKWIFMWNPPPLSPNLIEVESHKLIVTWIISRERNVWFNVYIWCEFFMLRITKCNEVILAFKSLDFVLNHVSQRERDKLWVEFGWLNVNNLNECGGGVSIKVRRRWGLPFYLLQDDQFWILDLRGSQLKVPAETLTAVNLWIDFEIFGLSSPEF